jgi:hypothetical protein
MTLPDPKKQAFDLFSRFSVFEGENISVRKSKDKALSEAQKVVAALGNNPENIAEIRHWMDVKLEITKIN